MEVNMVMLRLFAASFICILCFIQYPCYSEIIDTNQKLSVFEKTLKIKSSNRNTETRLEFIEKVLFGHIFYEDMESRIKNINNGLQYRKNSFISSYYNPVFGDYYPESFDMKEYKWSTFPITVYIKNNQKKYRTLANNAVKRWNYYIPIMVSNSPNSNITIEWTNKLPSGDRGVVGLTYHSYNGEIHRSKIIVRYKNRYSMIENEEIVIHELGHALGLGHSKNPGDIMYTSIKPYRKAIKLKNLISQRDLNTLFRVYSNYIKADDANYKAVSNPEKDLPINNLN